MAQTGPRTWLKMRKNIMQSKKFRNRRTFAFLTRMFGETGIKLLGEFFFFFFFLLCFACFYCGFW
jgi:hypothetical protein